MHCALDGVVTDLDFAVHLFANQVAHQQLAQVPPPPPSLTPLDRLSKTQDILSSHLSVEAAEKSPRHQGHTSGAFVPMRISSGGFQQSQLTDAWSFWFNKEPTLARIIRLLSTSLIRFRCFAYPLLR